jgi:hypothetical protein
VSIAAEQPNALAVPLDGQSIAIMFDLVEPVFSGRDCRARVGMQGSNGNLSMPGMIVGPAKMRIQNGRSLKSNEALSLRHGLGASSNALSIFLDLFGIFVVDAHYVIVGAVGGLKKFVELRVKSLGVPVFGPLNNQRHAPSGKCGECVPFKAVPYRNPRDAIQRKDNESCRARSKHP